MALRPSVGTLLAALVLFAAPNGAAADSSGGKVDLIRIGLPAQPGPDGKLVSGVASNNVDRFLKKEFAGSGTRIEWTLVTGAGPGINEAIASGALDFAYYGDFPSIIGRAGGLQTKLIVAGERGHNSYLLVPPNSSARSIKDLVGKRIAINKGRPWELAFSRLLSSNGLKESDVQLFNMAPADGDAALARSIDAIYENTGYASEGAGSAGSSGCAWRSPAGQGGAAVAAV